MHEKFKTIFINLFFILSGVVIFLILLEIGLFLDISFLGNQESNIVKNGEYIYYPEIGLGTYANRIVEEKTREYSVIINTNSIGFRDNEHEFEKDPNVFRIVILGDSFIEGDQVTLEQRFPALLEQKLNLNPKINKKIEIITLGRNGFGTDQEYLTLKNIGVKYHPNLVILAFYVGNDVRNNYLKFEKSYLNMIQDSNASSNARPFFIINKFGELEELPFQSQIANRSQITNRSQNIYKLRIYDILKTFKSPAYIYSKLKNFNRQKVKVNKGFNIDGIPIDYHIRKINYSSDWKEAWNITEALILKSSTESKENGAQFLLVSIADRDQIHNEYWNETVNKYPEMKNGEWDLAKPEKILSKFSKDNNITYIPLLEPFKDYVNRTNEKVHGHYDGHWNAKGHYLAAELLYDKILKEEIVPTKDE